MNAAAIRALVLLICGSLLLTAGCGGGGGDGRGREKVTGDLSGWNVILITLDTTRHDRLGCYGLDDAGTPVLDRMAAEGVLFENAVAQAPITLPTHASIFTGTYPPFHGVRGNGFYTLPQERTTLAEILTREGYETGAVVAARVLDRRFGLAQGFRIFDDEPSSMQRETEFSDYTRRAPAVNEAALEVVSQFEADRPYFLWVHYFDPHAPYEPLPGFADDFPATDAGRYQAEISTVDAYIGRLVDELERRGKMERTLVVVTADHGEGFLGSHGEQTHGIFVYGDTLRIPLIWWAGDALPAGLRRDELIRQIDVMPTILDLLGLDEGDETQGLSYRDVMIAPGEQAEFADVVSYSEAILPWYKFGWAPLLQVRDRRWKYIEAPRPELYDLVADPQELNNVVDDHPDVVARLEKELAEFLRQGTGADGFADQLVTTDEEREKLNALGYVGSGRRVPSGEGISTLRDLKDPKDWAHIQDRIHRARGLRVAGKIDDALREFESIVELDPENYEAYAALIEFLMSARRYDDAEVRIREVIEFRPETWKIWLVYGQLEHRRAQQLKKSGDESAAQLALGRAVRHFEEAGRLAPIESDPWAKLGSLYFEAGRPRDAEKALRRGRSIDPRSYRINSMLGTLLVGLGDNTESLAILEEALAAVPDIAAERGLRMSMIEVFARTRQFDRAEETVRWIEKDFPDDPMTVRVRAILDKVKADAAAAPRR